MASKGPIVSKNLSPQDILTLRKKGVISKMYVVNPPKTNSRPASEGAIVLVSRKLVITPAAAGGTWNNRIQLGTAPCCAA